MGITLSIFLAGIRPQNWRKLYDSVRGSTTKDFELIFVGPNSSEDIANLPNVKFIKDYGNPTRCYQRGLIESRGDYVTWAADDGHFLNNMSIDNAFSKLLSMGPSHKNVVSFKYFEGGIDNVRRSDKFWRMGFHEPIRAPYVPPNYYLLMNGLMHRDYLMQIGGWDCSFESHAIATCDLAVRVQNDGGRVEMLDEPFMHVDHFPDDSGDHAPIYFAHLEHDEPYFRQIYSVPESKLRTSIKNSNWEQSPAIWSRRFKGKDKICVNFVSRSRPESLIKSIDLVKSRMADRNNAILKATIDSDQIEMYKDLPEDVQIVVSEHDNYRMGSIVKKQLDDFLDTTDSYFLWLLPDDLTNVPYHWDAKLIENMNLYNDHTYCLYAKTSNLFRGRINAVFRECYAVDLFSYIGDLHAELFRKEIGDISQPDIHDFTICYHLSDMCPVFTRSFTKFVRRLFDYPEHQAGYDIGAALLVQQLKRVYGINRLVCFSKKISDSVNCDDQMHSNDIVLKYKYNLNVVREIVKEMHEFINA